jgi:hypothetical protein
MKTFTLTCPDPDCAEEFDIELEPATDLTDNSDLIECPACLEEWEWEYDAEADTLILLPDEDDEADDLSLVDTEDEGGEDPDE